MTYPKFIITKDFRVLKFHSWISIRDAALYERVQNKGFVSWRTAYQIATKEFDWFHFGRVKT